MQNLLPFNLSILAPLPILFIAYIITSILKLIIWRFYGDSRPRKFSAISLHISVAGTDLRSQCRPMIFSLDTSQLSTKLSHRCLVMPMDIIFQTKFDEHILGLVPTITWTLLHLHLRCLFLLPQIHCIKSRKLTL